jgi:hypothetical protein
MSNFIKRFGAKKRQAVNVLRLNAQALVNFFTDNENFKDTLATSIKRDFATMPLGQTRALVSEAFNTFSSEVISRDMKHHNNGYNKEYGTYDPQKFNQMLMGELFKFDQKNNTHFVNYLRDAWNAFLEKKFKELVNEEDREDFANSATHRAIFNMYFVAQVINALRDLLSVVGSVQRYIPDSLNFLEKDEIDDMAPPDQNKVNYQLEADKIAEIHGLLPPLRINTPLPSLSRQIAGGYHSRRKSRKRRQSKSKTRRTKKSKRSSKSSRRSKKKKSRRIH